MDLSDASGHYAVLPLELPAWLLMVSPNPLED